MPECQAPEIILGLETSCDETSAAIVKNGQEVLANAISSQIQIHRQFGGVVPEVASRQHLEQINLILAEALDQASLTFQELDAVAVTYGPGLAGALLVGVSAAKALAYALDRPLLGVNHLHGHLYAGFLEHDLKPPLLALVVSGGHTSFLYLKDHGKMEILGTTLDDAAGEAFDKVARALGLGYPGGPAIEEAARSGDPQAIPFPRAYLSPGSLDFSFSGSKSAVLNYLNQRRQRGEPVNVFDVAASFQASVVDVLVHKTLAAARTLPGHDVLLAGGVAANGSLRKRLKEELAAQGYRLFCPSPVYCTDNAAMIACAGHYQARRGQYADLFLNAVPNLPLTTTGG